MASKQLFANNAKGRLNAGITDSATSMTLQAGQGALFPNPSGGDWFMVTLIKSTGSIEVVKCTARSSDTLTIARAQEGTSNIAFDANDRVELRWTKGSAENMQQRTDVQVGLAEFFGVAGGSADAFTGTLSSDLTALTNGMRVRGQAVGANTVTNPTFNLTLGTTATGAKTVVKGNNKALVVNDIPGTDASIELQYDSSLDKWVLLNPATGAFRGTHTIWVPSGAMTPRTTNGPAPGLTELSTNKIMLKTLDFDQSTVEYAQFMVAMPKGWDLGTLLFKPVWTFASGSGNVVWGLRALALSDDDAIDQALGTVQEVTDPGIAANDMHVGPYSSAITVGGTPAVGDTVVFEVMRNASHASDTLSGDALLLGIEILINYNRSDDS